MSWVIDFPFKATITEYIRIPGSGGAPVFLEQIPIIAPAEEIIKIILIEKESKKEEKEPIIKIILIEKKQTIDFEITEKVNILVSEKNNIIIPTIIDVI